MKRTINVVLTQDLYDKTAEVSKKVMGQVNLAGLIKFLIVKKAEELGLNDK